MSPTDISRQRIERSCGGFRLTSMELCGLSGWQGACEHHGWKWGDMLQDLRYAFRTLSRSAGATALVLLLLAVGIGGNTSIFSLVNALYLKATPARDPGRLVRIFAKRYAFGAGFSLPEYSSLQGRTETVVGLAAVDRVAQLHLVNDGAISEVEGDFVTSNYTDVLGLTPAAGRFFLAEEDAVPGRNPVVVISYRLWKAQFGGTAATLGREIKVNGVPLKIIGVAPAGFNSDVAGDAADLWLPTMMLPTLGRACGNFASLDCTVFDRFVGRLAPGRTRQEAQAEVATRIVWSATDAVKDKRQRQVYVFPATGLDPDRAFRFRSQMELLMAAAGTLLLIACANLAGLFIARGITRRKEIAVRLSIGASRARIIRQLMTESLLLALMGTGFGMVLAFWGRDLIARFYSANSEGFSALYDLSFDWRVIAYSTGLALVSGVLFGLAPALTACRQDLVTTLKEGGASVGTQRHAWWRQSLVCGQVALSLVLLVSASLLVRSSRTVEQGTNFDPRHVVLLRLRPELLHFTPAQNEAYFRAVTSRLQGAPGVQSVAMNQGGQGLLWSWDSGREVQVSLAGQPVPTDETSGVRHRDVTAGFFGTLKIPILQGRAFSDADDALAPRVAIVNPTLAARLWPQGSAIGQSVVVNGEPTRVIGVAADIQPGSSVQAPEPYVYLSFWQSNPGKNGDVRLAVRVSGDPAAELPKLRQVVRALDPNIPLTEDMPMTEQVSLEYMPVLLARTVMGYCGLLALGLSAVGLYSVLAFSIRTRTREIGLRLALGARPKQVVQLVLGEGLRLGATGIVIGMIAATVATRLLSGWLFGVRSLDLLSFTMAAVFLLAAALLASYLPSRRASRVDPMVALRYE